MNKNEGGKEKRHKERNKERQKRKMGEEENNLQMKERWKISNIDIVSIARNKSLFVQGSVTSLIQLNVGYAFLPHMCLTCATFLINSLTQITKSLHAMCCLPGCALHDTGTTSANQRL